MTRKPSAELCCLIINRIKRQRESRITCAYLTAIISSRTDTEENEKLLEIRSDRTSPKNEGCGEDQSQTLLAFGR
jgi:hypothetical protein